VLVGCGIEGLNFGLLRFIEMKFYFRFLRVDVLLF
jgi:hypothetical protein